MSWIHRVKCYLESYQNFDHLHAGIPSSIYHRHRQAQLLEKLDQLMSQFENWDGSALQMNLPRGSDGMHSDFGVSYPQKNHCKGF